MNRMNGILLYTPEDAARNRWFIEQLCQYAESEGMSLRLCLSDAAKPSELCAVQPGFLINRSRLAAYSLAAEQRQIPCFNSAEVTAITNDKYQTYLHLHGRHRIPMAETREISPRALPWNLSYPLVAKPADGHGGAGVAWLRDADALAAYAESVQSGERFLIQKPVVTGWDVRLYILGGEIYAAVLRTSDTDFRSNFSLGGHAECIKPDSGMRALVRRILDIMPLDFAGIDLLRSPDGGYILGEIEDAVGCRMLYQLTDKDPAQDFIRYIRQQLS